MIDPYQKLEDLLRAAQVGSKDIDQKVWALLVADPPCPDPKKVGVTPPPYTTSLEAADALVRQLFGPKGGSYVLGSEAPYRAEVHCGDDIWSGIASGQTQPLAVVLAAVVAARSCQEA
jgi:hypothetical protein